MTQPTSPSPGTPPTDPGRPAAPGNPAVPANPAIQGSPAAEGNPAGAADPARPARIVFDEGREANRLHLGAILRSETVGGLLMIAATIAALLAANLAPGAYSHLSHHELAGLSIHEWAADGLLTIFFFVAGMELKREFTEGSLSRPADALLPIMAAVGGMVVPAGIYLAVNLLGDGELHGWAIPMATDIAFALAVLAIVGSQLPSGLRSFLLTLAIVDDLGAIAVIAIFFSKGFHLLPLLGALACVGVWWLAMRARLDLRRGAPLLFLALGVLAWWLMLRSGVHATIAGVALGLATRTDEEELNDPVDRWQHAIEPWSAGLVVPVFAFFAAGIGINGAMFRSLVDRPEALGVVLGLVAGKFLGVFSAARLTAHLTSAELAPGIVWRDVAALSALTGMGFTVSLLIADLAFPAHPELAESAKAAILVATLLAAVIGGVGLRHRNNRHLEGHARA